MVSSSPKKRGRKGGGSATAAAAATTTATTAAAAATAPYGERETPATAAATETTETTEGTKTATATGEEKGWPVGMVGAIGGGSVEFNFTEDSADDKELGESAAALGLDEEPQGEEPGASTDFITEQEVHAYLEMAFGLGAAITKREHWYVTEDELQIVVPLLTKDLNENAFFRKLIQKSSGGGGFGYLGYMIVKRFLIDWRIKRAEGAEIHEITAE